MKTNEKKITSRISICTTIGLTLGCVALFSFTDYHSNHRVNQTNKVTSLVTNNVNLSSVNIGFKIRSNPTNGFNGLTTSDGKYTYVLITKSEATGSSIGGANSGIACVDNNGDIIGTWYLPSDPVFDLNYTTNIVFGDKLSPDGKIVFDENKIFVLCGISNLAKAIDNVFTSYDTATHTLTTDISSGPTIKIFSLNVATPSTILNALNGNQCYEFLYPADETTGYSGFNENGVPYDMQMLKYDTPDQSTSITHSLYYASGVNFDTINPNTSATSPGSKFVPIQNTTITAFGSYLTYLTYGQNFAYHLNQTYKNSMGEVNSDEFIMSTSFVNVDQNIGGLYSASVNNNNAVDTDLGGIYSEVSKQTNWPVPFGYQWLLADIANNNVANSSGTQYSYVDATGTVKTVNWGDEFALTEPIIKFLNDQIFPLNIDPTTTNFDSNSVGSLFNTLQVSGRFGANWGDTTGYIIFTPKPSQPTSGVEFTSNNLAQYRYYYIAEIAMRSYDDSTPSVNQNATTYVFTNLLATNQVSDDGSINYFVGVAWANGKTVFNDDVTVNVSPLATLFTNAYTSMFCYDWASLSNDNSLNTMVQPLQSQLDGLRLGFLNDYYMQAKTSQEMLKKSFSNWNLVFLGGGRPNRTQQDKTGTIKSKAIDSSLTIDPTFGSEKNSIVYQLCSTAKDINETNLGRRLTFLRHQISFVIFPYKGFVYFTAGTSLEWQNGFSIWEVENVTGLSSMQHQYALGLEGSCVVGNTYLSEDSSNQPMWNNFDEAIYAIKQIKQPYGGDVDTLVIITSKGIYTVDGLNTSVFSGTVNDFLTNVSSFGKNSLSIYNTQNPKLLHAITFTGFDETIEFNLVPVLEVMVINHNLLWVQKSDPILYSAQGNKDYTVAGVIQYPPNSLADIPAAKPLIDVKTSAIRINTNVVTSWIESLSGTNRSLGYLQSVPLSELVTDLGLDDGQSLPANCKIKDTYDQDKFGSIFQAVNADGTVVNFEIPVVYGSNEIVYYAPIISENNTFGYDAYFTIDDLNITAPPVSIKVIVAIVVPVIVVIALILEFSVGLPMSKQRKINSLRNKLNQQKAAQAEKKATDVVPVTDDADTQQLVSTPTVDQTVPAEEMTAIAQYEPMDNAQNYPAEPGQNVPAFVPPNSPYQQFNPNLPVQFGPNMANPMNNYNNYPNQNNGMYPNQNNRFANPSTRAVGVYIGNINQMNPYGIYPNRPMPNQPMPNQPGYPGYMNQNPYNRNMYVPYPMMPMMPMIPNPYFSAFINSGNYYWYGPMPQRQPFLVPTTVNPINNYLSYQSRLNQPFSSFITAGQYNPYYGYNNYNNNYANMNRQDQPRWGNINYPDNQNWISQRYDKPPRR